MTAIVAISLQYVFSHKMAIDSATQLFNVTTKKTASHLTNLNQQVENTLKILTHSVDVKAKFVHPESRFSLAEIMEFNDDFYAISLGLESGDFYELINLESSPIVRKQLGAMSTDRWVVIEIISSATGKIKFTHYYNRQLEKRLTQSELSDYDPRTRLWYSHANEQNIEKTKPYLFHHLQAPGQTYSFKLPQQKGVIAIDIALSSLSDYLMNENDQFQGENDVEMYLFQKQGQLIASNHRQKQAAKKLPKAKKLTLNAKQQEAIKKYAGISISNEPDWAPIDFSIAGKPAGYSIDTLKLISDMVDAEFNFINGYACG